LTGEPRTATVLATFDCEVLEIEKKRWELYCVNIPNWPSRAARPWWRGDPLPKRNSLPLPRTATTPNRSPPRKAFFVVSGNSSNCKEPDSKRYHGYFRSVCGTGRFGRTLHAAGLAASSERSGKNES